MKRFTTLLSACLTLLVAGCGPGRREAEAPPQAVAFPQRFAEGKPPPPRPALQSSDRIQRTLPGVESYLASAFSELGVPGLAVGVIASGKLAFFRAYGVADVVRKTPITPQTGFRIGSVTKTFTGLALLALRDDGKLSLDDPAVKYLPELSGVIYPTRDSPLITLRHLMTHTSGLVRQGPLSKVTRSGKDPLEAEITALLSGMPLEYVPATDQVYSNLGTALEGLVIGRVATMRYRDFVTARLLRPLGMNATTWVSTPSVAVGYERKNGHFAPSVKDHLGAAEAAGGLYSTVEDMARYVAYQLDAWPARDDPEAGPVKRSTVRESHLVAGQQRAGNRGFGAHWVVLNDCELGHLVFHNGQIRGYKASVYFAPERGVGIVAFANEGKVDGLDDVTKRALAMLVGASAPLDPKLEAFAKGFSAALAGPTPEVVREVFSGRFLSRLPEEAVVAFLTSVGASSGACTSFRGLDARSELEADIELTCERGLRKLSVVLSPMSPHRVDSLAVTPIEACSAE